MNISILSFAFPPSNYPVSKRMYGLYASLLKSGHKIQIVTTNQMRFNKIFQPYLIFLKKINFGGLKSIFFYCKLIIFLHLFFL